MSRYFSNEFISKVRSSVDIVEIISATVSLKRVGKNFSGLCPFHSEKVPSFVVNREKQFFHCYGCHAGGDVFKFLMLRDNISFYQTVKLIAEEKNIPLPLQKRSTVQEKLQKRKEFLFQLNNKALHYFRENLFDTDEGKGALRYLEQRGISRETSEQFQLGYALSSWENLYKKFTASGIEASLLLEAGLIAKRSQEEGYYDFFRERLIFPIFNKDSKPVGFGGRLIKDGEPKYLNSPDTPIFRKSWNLYGLHRAHKSIRKKDFSLLVEGYFDLITLHQGGIDNAVAPLGTSFTQGHSKILSRYATKVITCFDSDDAGRDATKRAINTFLESGFQIKIAQLPKGFDPDSYLHEYGKEETLKRLKESKPAVEYLIEQEKKDKDILDPYQKVEALNELLPWLAKIRNSAERSAYLGKISERLKIKDDLVLEQLRQRLKKRKADPIPFNIFLQQMGSNAELRLLQIMIQQPDSLHQLLPQIELEYFIQPQCRSIFSLIKRAYLDRKTIAYHEIVESMSTEEEKDLLAQIASADVEPIEKIDVSLYINALKRLFLERKQKEIMIEIEEAQKINDQQKQYDLSMKKLQIKKEIEALS